MAPKPGWLAREANADPQHRPLPPRRAKCNNRRVRLLLTVALLACTPASIQTVGRDSVPDTAATDTAASDTAASDTAATDTAPTADTAGTDTADNADESAVFTVIAVPDTQFLAESYPEVFDETFAWIAEAIEEQEIAFVLGEGDVVENDSPNEWAVAGAAWRRLDGRVPYAVAVGNHDMTGEDTTRYNDTFSRSAQETLPGFGGTRLPDRMDDAWHTFRAGGVDWLVLSLSWTQSAEQLSWAAEIMDGNPDRRVIVTTHAYLQPGGSLDGQGTAIWSEVLSRRPNATLIVNGHYTSPTADRNVRVGESGHQVVELFANYQGETQGGMGRIRIMRFDPAAGTLAVSSYAPAYDAWLSDSANEFTLRGLDLGPL